tara:strand:+ start:419 stop:2473 length:2055 start_codon:yes stop_codon:yes gene_type:complete
MERENTLFITPDGDQKEEAYYENLGSTISSLRPERLIQYIHHEEKLYGLVKESELFGIEPITIAYKVFFKPDELDPETNRPKMVDIQQKSKVYQHALEKISKYFDRARELRLFDEDVTNMDNDNDLPIDLRINNLVRQLHDIWTILLSQVRIYDRINHPTQVPIEVSTNPSILDPSLPPISLDEYNDHQAAFQILTEYCSNNGLKRYKGYTCEQIKTDDGFATRAWRQKEEIKDFVYRVANRHTWHDLWKLLTNKDNGYIQIIKQLSACNDMKFPEIKKNRRVWSFKNGLFIGQMYNDQTNLYETKFYKYDSEDYKRLNPLIVSCKYFPVNFTDHGHIENWQDIPTPYFNSILKYQDLEDEVCHWMYVLGGRLFYEVGEMDKWQVIPFIKGIARSGKSTIITKVFSKFYEAKDVKTMSNNIEKQFGLGPISEGLIFVAPEIKGDFKLEQAEFQSIVSGDSMNIAIKGQPAKPLDAWVVPGFLGGNETPGFKDKQGSVVRRVFTFDFKKQVTDADSDPTLDDKLAEELPIILEKCARAYLDYAQKYNNRDIWDIAPQYFLRVREQISSSTNPLERFLQVGYYNDYAFKTGDDVKFPLDVFEKIFGFFCTDKKMHRPRFDEDFYNTSFSTRKYEVRTEKEDYFMITNPERLHEPSNFKGKKVIYGFTMDVKENTLGYDVTSQIVKS